MPARPTRHKNTSVTIAYVRPSQVAGKFCDSLSSLVMFDAGNQGYLKPPGGTIAMQSSPRIAEARSQVIDEFIKPNSPVGAEWLLWLDADASFEPSVLAQLMSVANADTLPVVGALAFGGSGPENMFPVVFSLEPDGDSWKLDKVLDYPRDALVKVGAVGCHCVLVHRSVFIKMAAAFSTRKDGTANPYPWYAEGVVSSQGVPFGEDTVFCVRAQMLDIPIHLHTGIRTGHVKECVLDETLWDAMQKPVEPVAFREFKIA